MNKEEIISSVVLMAVFTLLWMILGSEITIKIFAVFMITSLYWAFHSHFCWRSWKKYFEHYPDPHKKGKQQ